MSLSLLLRALSAVGFAGLLAYFGHYTLAVAWLAINALAYALFALNGVIRLEKRFPEK